ncbi:Transforming growth factor beta activator LRRC32 [Dissostichus eleginoides]|uniref:Transforming growth factor beta activator LRRC32 n=1 Tax=Dissostichus eleginoides TaxID=100907 RepID=A0AAD9EZI7_DISEL|nr:Transforming growth factor beta activator LRRC32 [Dissostichus eleginoides]
MACLQLLLPLMVSCVAASERPPRQLPACQVVQMDVFCSDLSLRSAPVDLPHGVRMLDLSLNQVQNLSQETLAFQNGFHHLNLRANKIHFIQPGLFKDMTDLRVLDLSRNHLNVFAHAKINIGPLTAVESLDLSNNGLYTGMSDYFLADSPSLMDLSLNGNSITKIAHNTFSGSSSLRRISLHNNVILEIEDGAFEFLDHLTELDFSKNSITCITDFNLCNLKVLNLSKNSVEFFHSAASMSLTFGENTLPSLEKLFLQGNDLTTLDHGIFQRLPSIKHLHLQQNDLKICSSENEPQDCVSFSSIPTLQFLNLSENYLMILPANAFANTSLKLLDLSLNPGLEMDKDSLSGLEHTLIHLLLKENNISSLNTDLSSLKSLKHIDLSTNQLTNIPVWSKDSSIESLNLQNNNLVTLKYSSMLALEHSLKTLYMGSNPLSCCSNLDFLQMVQRSAVVVPDIETVTCVHEEYSEPVNIEKVVIALVLLIAMALLVRYCLARKRKHIRSFTA